ncbi:Acetyltransferase (GNAT) family protein [Cohnella sp. OV330]|uniref:GNAT family N-acetyltransferase n=1 Tax=Cohnella sp. OV330 TaxID=1855288 RepID=UPI0008EA9F50|nr:GNAT family N-acetyltransferase [Cohnella sp. OV330]SFB51637.1 Acetyltransferase (GNAT) family protein [Cohnella sp. OV330]
MRLTACTIADIRHLLQEYLRGLSSPFDSFLEGYILSSSFYLIQDGSEDVGYLAVHDSERLTQFYIRPSYLRHAQKLFLEALERYSVKSIFVATSDELLMSLALDQDFAIRKQAYFFQDGQAEFTGNGGNGEVIRLAVLTDLSEIERVCGDFLEAYDRLIEREEIFVYRGGAELLGIGLIEASKMFEGLASVGMFVNPAYRMQGVGKAIILHLRKWCKDRGIVPVAGCWYYNEESKRTLESGGMVTKTRLLNIEVTHNRGTSDIDQKS